MLNQSTLDWKKPSLDHIIAWSLFLRKHFQSELKGKKTLFCFTKLINHLNNINASPVMVLLYACFGVVSRFWRVLPMFCGASWRKYSSTMFPRLPRHWLVSSCSFKMFGLNSGSGWWFLSSEEKRRIYYILSDKITISRSRCQLTNARCERLQSS